MASTSGGLIDGSKACPDCGRICAKGRLAMHQGKQPCLKAQATGLHRNPRAPVTTPTTQPEEEDLSSVLRQLRQSNQLIRRIPKSARYTACDALIVVLGNCVTGDGGFGQAWSRLLQFAYGAFSLPASKEERTVSLVTLIKQNLTRTSGFLTTRTTEKRKPTKPSKSKLQKGVMRKMNDGDISGSVRLLSSEDAVATPSAEVLASLQSKHPKARTNAVFPDPPSVADPAPDPITAAEVLEAISSFPNGSAGGIDGLTPQHLKDMVSGSVGEAATRLAEKLATVLNIMLKGGVPEEICPLLYGAGLIALNKKDGGTRPIAVGNTLRRLLGKIISRREMQRMGTLLRPLQLGYGTPGGAEAVVHAARAFLEEEEKTQALLKLDFKNAFNTVDRGKMLEAVRAHLPQYYAAIWKMYRRPTELFFGEFLISSESGAQQRDPIAPMIFCLLIMKMTRALTSPLNCWYLDDGVIGGSVESVLRDLQVVVAMGTEIGLELNLSKCEIFVFGGSVDSRDQATASISRDAPAIIFPCPDGLSLLGAPLLSDGIAGAIVAKRVTISLLTSRFDILPTHQALFLLKCCLGVPKVLYLLRCTPTWKYRESLQDLDEVLRMSVAAICNTEMTPAVWRQASLPISSGGLGIRRTSELAYSAFLASVHSTESLRLEIFPLVDNDKLLALPTLEWCTFTGKAAPLRPRLQKNWDIPVMQVGVEEMMANARPRDKARILALRCKESGKWLNALPIPCLGNLLDDDCTRIAIGLRLGADVCQPHTCRCGIRVNKDGHHGLSCVRSAGRNSRHAAINNVIKRALTSAGIPSVLEPSGLEREGGKRPDGMSLIPWSRGLALVWDATVWDTMAASNIAGTMLTAGDAATKAEARKNQHYEFLQDRFLFSAIAFETFGPSGPETKKLLSTIGRRIAEKTGEKKSFEYLNQRISIEIQRGNAVSILGTHPHSRELDEIYSVLNVKRY